MSDQRIGITTRRNFSGMLGDTLVIEIDDSNARLVHQIDRVAKTLRAHWPECDPCFILLLDIQREKGFIYLKYGLFETWEEK